MEISQDSLTPTTGRRWHRLTRDNRLRILTLYNAGHSKEFIMSTLNVSKGQFYRTVSSGRVSPLRSSGRPHALTSEQVDELVAYICQSRETRRMTFLELSMNFPHWGVGQYAIGSALKRRGYQQRRSRYKPPLSEAVRAQRLSWAQQRVNWTLEEWFSIS
ncbi:hypothetical protein K3495_g6636 [Podosphaera aphanis]|nr:hypothetical protein K3495_g6636 [Podosphaera aphanis]